MIPGVRSAQDGETIPAAVSLALEARRLETPATVLMARKKKSPKRTWFRAVLLFLLVPLGVWFAAFLIWFSWYDLKGWLSPERLPEARSGAPRPGGTGESRKRAPGEPRERLFDEDRKNLEDILRRRS